MAQPVQSWGALGTGDTDFREPVGIDVLPSGEIAVVDSLNKRVKIYTPEGGLVRNWPIQTAWNGEGGFESHIASLPDGTIYLTDPREATVHIYSPEGKLINKINSSVDNEPLRQPLGITATQQGQILISDFSLGKIMRVK